MANSQVLLSAALCVVLVSIVPSLWSQVDAKFSLSNFQADLLSGNHHRSHQQLRRNRVLGENDVELCSQYTSPQDLPAGHPCATKVGLLAGLIRQAAGAPPPPRGPGGNRPPGVGRHPPGVGKHPPINGRRVGHHPPGVGHHPPGVGHHPPGVGHHTGKFGDHCNLPKYADKVAYCLSTKNENLILIGPGATTCCRKSCRDLRIDNKNCGRCGNKCRKATGGPLCCGGTCVERDTVLNCGACGVTCKTGEICDTTLTSAGKKNFTCVPGPSPPPPIYGQ